MTRRALTFSLCAVLLSAWTNDGRAQPVAVPPSASALWYSHPVPPGIPHCGADSGDVRGKPVETTPSGPDQWGFTTVAGSRHELVAGQPK